MFEIDTDSETSEPAPEAGSTTLQLFGHFREQLHLENDPELAASKKSAVNSQGRFKCSKCGHEWAPEYLEFPDPKEKCQKCKSWNDPCEMNTEYREKLLYHKHNMFHCSTYRQYAAAGLYRTPYRTSTGEMILECTRPCCGVWPS